MKSFYGTFIAFVVIWMTAAFVLTGCGGEPGTKQDEEPGLRHANIYMTEIQTPEGPVTCMVLNPGDYGSGLDCKDEEIP